jgi:iron(II)-dependent oxidoreductase
LRAPAFVLVTAAVAILIPGLPGPMTAAPSPADCGRCHVDGSMPSSGDQHDPACRECHLPGSERPPASTLAAPPHARPAAPPPAETERIIQQTMVLIPAGPFWMGNNGRGADGPGDEDEQPLHQVAVDAFYMDQYETTNAMYKTFVDATGGTPPKQWPQGTYPPGRANHPVTFISWHEASEFCRWAGKRLPTEAEWEKAARGADQRIFPWGNDFDPTKANTPQHWLALKQPGNTMPVGSFEAGKSPYGLYDMAGNVYEWVADWYLPYPGNQFPNRQYGHRLKIVRGGSWYDCLSYGCGLSSPSYNRSRFNPDVRNKGFGFRCAKSPAVR